MTSNLPPGCRVSDIPGNRPEDFKAEAIGDMIYDALEKAGYKTDTKRADKAVELIHALIIQAERSGFADGEAEVRMWNKVIPYEGEGA